MMSTDIPEVILTNCQYEFHFLNHQELVFKSLKFYYIHFFFIHLIIGVILQVQYLDGMILVRPSEMAAGGKGVMLLSSVSPLSFTVPHILFYFCLSSFLLAVLSFFSIFLGHDTK